MYRSTDDELTCIGAGAVVAGARGYDTTSDRCEWVRQYVDWTERPSPPLGRMLTERSAPIALSAFAGGEWELEPIADHCMAL